MTVLLVAALAAVAIITSVYVAHRYVRRQIADHALHDTVTGLPRRELFEHRVTVALARARRHAYRVATLFVDLDRFKRVNDNLGYQKGDQLLEMAALRMVTCLREEDTSARLGADQFTVLLEEVSGEVGAARVAQRIVDAMQRPFELDGEEVFVGASIGVALSDDGEISADDLQRRAALAMQRAKERGKGRYEIFEPTMMARAARRLMLESDLRRGIDEGELRLVYEPEVLLHSGEVASLEALVRWKHPTEGVLEPATFIPLAEETGLIVPLGRWVLEEACHATKRLNGSYPRARPLSVSVNVSARQLERPECLAAEVTRVLNAAGLSPEQLTLEITESVLMEHSDTAIAAVQSLRDIGVGVAIDDFGTGYSSLSYLKHFPFSVLKLDQSFVQGVAHPVDSAIVRSVLELAERLELKVTAEGIESGDQLLQLRQLGCPSGQGFYLSRPVPEEGLPSLIEGSSLRSAWWSEATSVIPSEASPLSPRTAPVVRTR